MIIFNISFGLQQIIIDLLQLINWIYNINNIDLLSVRISSLPSTPKKSMPYQSDSRKHYTSAPNLTNNSSKIPLKKRAMQEIHNQMNAKPYLGKCFSLFISMFFNFFVLTIQLFISVLFMISSFDKIYSEMESF